MVSENKPFKRRSIRLSNYDYSQQGLYFITICANHRLCLFGKIEQETPILNRIGHIIDQEWNNTELLRSYVKVLDYVIMPNHFHGIIEIKGLGHPSTVYEGFQKTIRRSIPSIIKCFKGKVTKEVRIMLDDSSFDVWQRGYYEHVIRDDKSYENIVNYIHMNPCLWDQDRYFVDQ